MKTTVKILVAIALVLSSSYTQAQSRIGIKGGVNSSTMTLSVGDFNITPDSKIGINLGVISEIPLIKDFYLQPGLLFTTKGFKSGDYLTMTTNNIEIPINALFKLNAGSIKVLGFAGPYIGYAISGKAKSGDESESIKFSGDDKEMNALDLGLNFGAGVEIKNLQITAQYGFGLTNLVSKSDSGSMKNKVFGLSIAYLFGE